MWNKRNYIGVVIVAVAAMAMMAAGCERGPQSVDRQEPSITLSANDRTIMVGETTTVFAQTANLLGREHEIEWDTSLGEIQEREGGRLAQFSSNQPGTAMITAEMNVDGRIYREQINITVNAME